MKRVLSVFAFLITALVVATPPTHAFQTTYASYYDVQRLQDDLAVLEDTLATVPTSHPRYREFQKRSDDLRQDLTQLRDDMERGRRDDRNLGVSVDEVNRVRDRIATLQSDVDNALDRRWTGTSMTLPEGTELVVRLAQPLSSRTARVEDRVEATLARPLYVDNRTLGPAGTRVMGTVTQAERAQKPLHGGKLTVSFDRLLLSSGQTVDIATRVVHVSEDVDHKGDTVKHGAIGAALGGILGAVIGGSKGAIVGVLLGGAGGAITATGDDVELPEGTVFTLQLDRPVTVQRR
jgi:hypothetical protein